MTHAEIFVASDGRRKVRAGYDVLMKGAMPVATALEIGRLFAAPSIDIPLTAIRLEELVADLYREGRVDTLMSIAEIAAAAVDTETSRQLVQLRGDYTRQRHGLVPVRGAVVRYDTLRSETA